MHIVKLLIEKLKKLVKDYKTEKWWSNLTDEEQSRWCSGLSDEELRQEEKYHRECEEEYERWVKEQREFETQFLQEKRVEEENIQRRTEDQEWLTLNYSRCKGCGEFKCECRCNDD